MEKSYKIVKRWNAEKGSRYPTNARGGEGDSAIVQAIKRMIAFVGDESEVERYFDDKRRNTPTGDIWLFADKYACKRWLNENPIIKNNENPAPVYEAPKAPELKLDNVLGALGKQIVEIIGGDMAKDVASKVKSELDNYVADKTIIKVVEYDGTRRKIEEMTHECFETVLKFVAMNEPVFLTGPAGSGKNVICEQVAKALGLDFYFSNAVTQEYKLTGYGDAMGNFVETQFYKWCVNGGVFMLDEMDASVPEALIVLNCAIANGYFDFPVIGRVELNKNCRLIACGNTWGTGASMEYVGRNQLDGATLNRFACVSVDYDKRIEKALAGENNDILELCRAFRKIASQNGCHCIVSYREINRLHKMIDIAGMDVTTALKLA